MRCDDVRKSVAEGAPLDDAARGHIAACPACAEEFEALLALVTARSPAPAALRDRVLAAYPAPRGAAWKFLAQAAAFLIVGLGMGFGVGYSIKSPREVVRTEIVTKNVPIPTPDDVISNIGIAAQRVYGKKVEVTFAPDSVRVEKIVVDPLVRNCEQWCPVARELKALSEERPDVVGYRKKIY